MRLNKFHIISALFLIITSSSCSFSPLRMDSFREPAQSKGKQKAAACDPDSEFVKHTTLICQNCSASEFCVTVYYDKDTFSSIKKRVIPLLKSEVSTQRNISGPACMNAISSIADEIASHSLGSTLEFKNHPARKKEKHLAQMIAFDKASIHNSSSIKNSCGDDCAGMINTGKEWAQVVTDGSTSLREIDVRSNISSWKKELKIPVSCQYQFEIALRNIFKDKLRVVVPVESSSEESLISDEADNSSGIGSGESNQNGNGNGNGNQSLLLKDDNAPVCQEIPEDVIVGTDSGRCLADEQKLWDFLENNYLKNLQASFSKSMKTPVMDCTAEDITGGSGDKKPTPNGAMNVKVPCNACVTSTDILGLLSEKIDKNAESLSQRGRDWVDYRYCWVKLGFGTTSSGVNCKDYINKYQGGTHQSNAARMIGPEHLPALEKALEDFERKGYESEKYRNLTNGAIRVPTKIVIPGLNRRICLAGQWISYDKSQAMRNGEMKANAANEKYYVWDRNFGQGATNSVANWLHLISVDPNEEQMDEIDCVSIPARLVREAMKEQRCGGISAIRTMILEGLKSQGQGKALINVGVSIATGMLPVGLAGSAVMACSQGALEARSETLNKEARIDRERLSMVMLQNREEFSKVEALQKFYEKNKANWDEEKNKLYTAGYWSVLENCLKNAATVGIYYQITKGANKIITVSKVSGTPKKFFEQLANAPVLVDTVIHSVSRREVTWVEVVSLLPINLRVEGLTLKALRETVDYELKTNGKISESVKSIIVNEINNIQTKGDKKEIKIFISKLTNSVTKNTFKPVKITEKKAISKKKNIEVKTSRGTRRE